jgi:glyoxylase I family protein
MNELASFHHVAVTVSNLDVSATWYTEVLGFETAFREDGDDRKACVMRFRAGRYSVGLVQHGSAANAPFDPSRVGLDHLAFDIESRDQIDEWAARLTASGVEHSGVIDVPPGAILNLKDPDGIALALFWERA